MLKFKPYKYLIIAHNKYDICSDYNLKRIMDEIAYANGASNAKSYFSGKVGCSKTVIKLITKPLTCTRVLLWDRDIYKDKDSYRIVKKISIEHYVRIIQCVIDEFHKINTNTLRDELFASIKALKKQILIFKDALCYQTVEGLHRIKGDEATANRVNRIENAVQTAQGILDKLAVAEKEIL